MGRKVLAVAAIAAATLGFGGVQSAEAGELDGMRSCAEIAAAEGVALSEVKLDRAPVIGDVVVQGPLSVTITDVKTKEDGEVIGFKGSALGVPVQYVIVKSGQTTKVYDMSVVSSDGGFTLENTFSPGGFLFTAGQAVTGKSSHQQISYLAFCY